MKKYPIAKLITDFDETVSAQDTISLLVHVAADTRKEGKAQFLAAWQEMVEWYSIRYHRICDEWLTSGAIKSPQTSNLPHHATCNTPNATLTDFLISFEELELASIQRVVEKGFLTGLTREGLRTIGRQVVKKPGVDRVLSTMRVAGVEIEILSANWSMALIEGAMEGLYDQVIANCLVYDATGRSTGNIHRRVVSARDKLRNFRKQRCVSSRFSSAQTEQPSETGWTLYIGDSVSDFLSILDADLGILIGKNRVAMQTLERFHLPLQQLREGMRFNPVQHYQGTILSVDSWEALVDFLSPVNE